MERDEVYLRAKKGGEFKSVLYSFNGLYSSELNAFIINIISDSSKLWFYIHLQVGESVSLYTV